MKLFESSELHQYYFIDGDGKRQDIKSMSPADVASFWRCVLNNESVVIVHYTVIKVESTCTSQQKA